MDSIPVEYVSLPSSAYYSYKEIGDQMPNRMTLNENILAINDSEKGVAIYELSDNNGLPIYKGNILNENNAVASEIVLGGAHLFVSNMSKGKDKQSIYMFTFDVKSSITNQDVDDKCTTAIYDIVGRKVANSTNPLKNLPSGLYIINGKKIAVR